MLLVWLFGMPVSIYVGIYIMVGVILAVVLSVLDEDVFYLHPMAGFGIDFTSAFFAVFLWPLVVVGAIIRFFLVGIVILGEWVNDLVDRKYSS